MLLKSKEKNKWANKEEIMDKIKVVYLATPDIAIKSFEFFINSPDYEVQALITQKAKAQNRGKKIVERNIVKIAKENKIKVFEPDKISKSPEIIEEIRKMQPDFLVTFAFGQILSQEVIDLAKFNTINLHASLLPKYRGANPISQCIVDGCKVTGITTMKTVLELDAGDICMQEKIEISPEMNVIELMDKISILSPDLLDKTLKGLYQGTLVSIPQKEEEATFSKKIKKEQKEIDWQNDNISLHNKIRGMYKINTNHTRFNNKLIQIIKTSCIDNTCECDNCGEIVEISKKGLVVQCKKGSLLIETVKPEGKGEIKAYDWANGARIKKGDCFNSMLCEVK